MKERMLVKKSWRKSRIIFLPENEHLVCLDFETISSRAKVGSMLAVGTKSSFLQGPSSHDSDLTCVLVTLLRSWIKRFTIMYLLAVKQ